MDREKSSAIWKPATVVGVSILSRISGPVESEQMNGKKKKNRRYIKSIWFVVVGSLLWE